MSVLIKAVGKNNEDTFLIKSGPSYYAIEDFREPKTNETYIDSSWNNVGSIEEFLNLDNSHFYVRTCKKPLNQKYVIIKKVNTILKVI